ncbi:hypothetical protein SAMN05444280_12511 [Tangfeifania diversioriginum]|uniref:Cytochrome c domain-containing protein n=1 Tax=Tangfeifania diversioriginum TaxID=1168035 RepID=A0A1M6KZT4_9BACT|nr:hypothetical protein [Tangfeifania diversioriginum]SHJ64384.1 hypothetical protein SAMN05444280_12511 [Tangfeifania diversioriginum]
MKKNLSIVILTLAAFFITETIQAIPAFARKYRLSCTTCHTPAAPALKAYGDEFAGNGFRLEEESSPRYYVETGDTELSLLRELPIAVRLDGFVTYNMGGNERSDFASPYIIKLLSGGEISERLSYYFYFYFSERGEVAGVEDAFLMYNDLFGIDLDIALGQFQVSDPLFKRELRLSLEDYVLYTSQIGNSGIGLKYDKGVMVTMGLDSGTGVSLEVTNGNGLPEAQNRVFDHDKYKNFLLHLSQDFGKMVNVGAFAFTGKEDLMHSFAPTSTNEVFIWGPNFTFAPSPKITLNAQYLQRSDSQIYSSFNSSAEMEDVKTDGAMAELIFSPGGDQTKWYLLGLYNWVESDFNAADYQSVTFHAGYLLRRNVRLVAEYTLDFTYSDHNINKFNFGFVSAF